MDGIQKIEVTRPWGRFEQYCDNVKCAVKMHFFKPNEMWSLQYHYNRDEFWKIIKGKAVVTIGDKEIKAKEGDEFFCKRGEKHRIKAVDGPIEVLEICFGEFDENDEVRLEDKYKRVTGTIY
jgi:mannose-1-phosphate guanylyltransferase/mannose-1-phosphate guanylyltransferase/mannose-6-phosphate isomerase